METAIYITLALLGIGLIIFLHELGHFLAAKKAGVRVERFALGFDPEVRGRRLRFFSFRRGETEYVIGMILFGGYVKLAGEMIPDPETESTPPKQDELLAQPVGSRAFIFAAGPAMSILSAFVLFVIAFRMGVPFTESRVGTVLPGSPAWEAGIQPEDRIQAIDDKKVVEFYELGLGVALASRESELMLEVLRPTDPTDPDSELVERTIEVAPHYDEDRGLQTIGVRPATDPVLFRDPAEGSPAADAGLRKGDRIVGLSVGDEALPPLAPSLLVDALSEEVLLHPDRTLRIRYERDGARHWVELDPGEPAGEETGPRIGILGLQAGTTVGAVAKDSAAAPVFRTGDRVLSVNGKPWGTVHWRTVLERTPPGSTLRLELVAEGGERREATVSRDDFLLWNLRQDIHWVPDGVLILELEEDSPLAEAGLDTYDRVRRVKGKRVRSADEVEALLEAAESPFRIAALREGEGVSVRLEPPFEDGLGVTWSAFPPVRAVVSGGPADRAGIRPGSIIVRLGESEIVEFQDLREALSGLEAEEAPVVWIDAAGERHEADITPTAMAPASFGVLECLQHVKHVVRGGLVESFGLGIHRTVTIGKQVFLTLRSLLRRDVSAKNLSGPVGITHVFTRAAESGWSRLIYFMAMVSVNLGLLNLLPFPILDGGHLLFLAIEKVKGSPVPARIQELAASIAFLLIIALFLFVTFHDVQRVLP